MKLIAIERRTGLTKQEFEKDYQELRKPVIFTDLATSWPATQKWTFDWLRTNYGHLNVRLYDNNFRNPGKNYLVPTIKKSFGEYLDIIESGPSELRLFLYNIFKDAPEMANDFSMPTITDGFLKNYPLMFFGGQGAKVDLHYDLDCAAVFITQFQRKKKIILFPHDQGDYLYQHPFTVQSEVDFENPDYEKHPALKLAQGYEAVLEHGETLFMPSQMWHYMYYTEGSFSLSLRRHSIQTRALGVYHVSKYLVDKGMNAVLRDKWKDIKANSAKRRAESAMY